MHHIYHTEGIILGSRNFGEAGKYYYLLTRELGLVVASASGVRKHSSKLRFILQDFNYLNFDLVRGKDFWRLTSALTTGKLENLTKNFETFKIVGNIARLLRRLLPGEEANEALFDSLIQDLASLESAAAGEIQNIEVVAVLRILRNLGYLSGEKIDELANEVARRRLEILSLINNILRETHL